MIDHTKTVSITWDDLKEWFPWLIDRWDHIKDSLGFFDNEWFHAMGLFIDRQGFKGTKTAARQAVLFVDLLDHIAERWEHCGGDDVDNVCGPLLQRFDLWSDCWTDRIADPQMLIGIIHFALQKGINKQ